MLPSTAVVEDQDRQVVFHAVGDGRGVHDAQVAVADFFVGELAEQRGGRVFFGVGGEDAVDARGLHEDVGFELHRFLGGGRVGGDERRAGAAGEDHDAAFFEVAACAAADVRLGDAVHANGRHQPRLAAERFERVLQREAVDHRGEHAHVVGRGFLDAGVAGGELGAAEDVAAADDDGDLNAELRRPVRTWAAMSTTSCMLMPRWPGAAKLSPESFRRMRL